MLTPLSRALHHLTTRAHTTMTTPLRATALQLSSLSCYSTCEVSDALLKLKVGTGGYVPDLEIMSRGASEAGRVVGEAYTVTMVDQRDVDAPKLTAGHFVDLTPEGSIMVISSPPHVVSASFGGLLGTAASVRGVKGVVIDGRCRDLSELRGLKLPVFSRGHSTLGQSPFTRPSAVQVPILISPRSPAPSNLAYAAAEGITVHPYDVVIADEDGVVVVRPELLGRLLELVEIGRGVDEKCRVDLEAGRGVQDTFGEHRGKK